MLSDNSPYVVCPMKGRPQKGVEGCRKCRYRKKCRSFQLWIQPELPLKFNPPKILKLKFDRYSKGKVDSHLHMLNVKECKALKSDFIKAIKTHKNLYHKYLKYGFDNKCVMISFYQYVENSLLSDEKS